MSGIYLKKNKFLNHGIYTKYCNLVHFRFLQSLDLKKFLTALNIGLSMDQAGGIFLYVKVKKNEGKHQNIDTSAYLSI